MERTVEALNIKDYVGDGTADPKRAIQVHDYVSGVELDDATISIADF